MSKLTILVFLFALAFAKTTFSENIKPKVNLNFTTEFFSLSEEFVLLHLVKKLSTADELFKTVNGRLWLQQWENKRNSILKKVMLLYDDEKKSFKLYSNWSQRLHYFQQTQKIYFKIIAKDFDVRREPYPWPEITFDSDVFQVFLDKNQLETIPVAKRQDADPIATSNDIEYVLRMHKPFSEDEKIVTEIEDSLRVAEELAEKPYYSYKYPEDVNVHRGYKEIRKYRALIKKYYIIDQEIIRNLQRVQYKLLFESFKGKHLSELYYQSALFHAERIITQLDLWKKIGGSDNESNDDNFNKIFPPHFQVLSDDKAYRKFLNFDDIFFKGNLLFGYKNRYDDPALHGYGFEYTAEVIVGKRFKPMLDLYNEIKNYTFLSNNFTNYNLMDVPSITLYLERFKQLTFWFSQRHFDEHQWISVKISNHKLYMVRPKNFKSCNIDEMFQEVKNNIERAKNQTIIDTTNLTFDSSKGFNGQSFYHSMSLKSSHSYVTMWPTILAIKMINLLNSQEAEPSTSLTDYLLQTNDKHSKNTDSNTNKKNSNDDKLKNSVTEIKTDSLSHAVELFNHDNNYLMTHNDNSYYQEDFTNSKIVTDNFQHVPFGSGGDINNGHHISFHHSTRVHYRRKGSH